MLSFVIDFKKKILGFEDSRIVGNLLPRIVIYYYYIPFLHFVNPFCSVLLRLLRFSFCYGHSQSVTIYSQFTTVWQILFQVDNLMSIQNNSIVE